MKREVHGLRLRLNVADSVAILFRLRPVTQTPLSHLAYLIRGFEVGKQLFAI